MTNTIMGADSAGSMSSIAKIREHDGPGSKRGGPGALVISGDSTANPNETRGCSQIHLQISEDDHVAGVDFGSRYGYVLHLLVLALTSITSVSQRSHICSVTN